MEKILDENEFSEIYAKQEKIKKHSQRISNILLVIKYFCRLVTIYLAIVSIGILVGLMDVTYSGVVINSVVEVIMPIIDFSFFVDGPEVLLATYVASSVLMFIVSIQISNLQKIVKEWANGDSPFNSKYVGDLRHISLAMSILMMFFQPLLVLFGVVLFVFTYLMEYGSVLEKNAQNTIKSHEQMIMSLAEIIEAKSGQTGLHVKRVSEYSKVLAEGLDMSTIAVDEIRVAAMLHDIGKLLIPSEILEKPGKLTDEEFLEIKKHTKYGYDLLENTTGTVLHKAKNIAYEHHEKWDGNGYSHIVGDEISLEARIVAVADVFDALVSTRSYKKPWSDEDAKQEIEKSSGTHFDPEIVKVFIEQYDKILEIKNKYSDDV